MRMEVEEKGNQVRQIHKTSKQATLKAVCFIVKETTGLQTRYPPIIRPLWGRASQITSWKHSNCFYEVTLDYSTLNTTLKHK